MMHLHFYFSKDFKNFMFEDLNIHGTAGIVVAFIVCMLCTVLLEGLKSLQYYYRIRMNQPTTQTETKIRQRCMYSGFCTLHVTDVFVAYLLMLAVMSYDAYILLAVILGSGIGYFIFGAVNTMIRFPTKRTEFNGFDNPACTASTTVPDRELQYSATKHCGKASTGLYRSDNPYKY